MLPTSPSGSDYTRRLQELAEEGRSPADVDLNSPESSRNVPCGRLFFRISSVSLASNQAPETLTCGMNEELCRQCLSIVNLDPTPPTVDQQPEIAVSISDSDSSDSEDIEEETNDYPHYPDDNPDVVTAVSTEELVSIEEGHSLAGRCVASIRNYIRTHPLRSTAIGVGVIAATAGLGYGIYRAVEASQRQVTEGSTLASQLGERHRRDVSSTEEQEQSTTRTSQIENLHQASILEAVRDLNGTTNRRALVRFEFENETCQHSSLSNIFATNISASELAQNKSIVWSSDLSGRPVTSVRLNREEFTRALEQSVNNSDCIQRVSAEPIYTRQTLADIRRSAARRDLLERMESAQQAAAGRVDEVCIQVEGDELGQRHVECRALYRSSMFNQTENDTTTSSSQTTSAPTTSPLPEPDIDTSEACVSSIAIISDGIRNETASSYKVQRTVRFNQTATASSRSNLTELRNIPSMSIENGSVSMDEALLRSSENQTVSEMFAESALRRCPNLSIQDYRVGVGVRNRGDNETVASVITAEYLTQALDHIYGQPAEQRPDAVVIIEPDPEPSNYLPDMALAGDYIEALSESGTRVAVLDRTDASWLTETPYMRQVDSVSEAIAMEQDFTVNAPSISPETAIRISSVAFIGATAALGIGVGMQLRARRRRAARREQAFMEAHEMQPLSGRSTIQTRTLNRFEVSEADMEDFTARNIRIRQQRALQSPLYLYSRALNEQRETSEQQDNEAEVEEVETQTEDIQTTTSSVSHFEEQTESRTSALEDKKSKKKKVKKRSLLPTFVKKQQLSGAENTSPVHASHTSLSQQLASLTEEAEAVNLLDSAIAAEDTLPSTSTAQEPYVYKPSTLRLAAPQLRSNPFYVLSQLPVESTTSTATEEAEMQAKEEPQVEQPSTSAKAMQESQPSKKHRKPIFTATKKVEEKLEDSTTKEQSTAKGKKKSKKSKKD